MKMIRAVVRPEKEDAVAAALAKADFPGMTKWDVVGRGKQFGVLVGNQIYAELAKTIVMLVVEDDQVDAALKVIRDTAFTGYPGDGKVFITPVEMAYTIRSGKAEL